VNCKFLADECTCKQPATFPVKAGYDVISRTEGKKNVESTCVTCPARLFLKEITVKSIIPARNIIA